MNAKFSLDHVFVVFEILNVNFFFQMSRNNSTRNSLRTKNDEKKENSYEFTRTTTTQPQAPRKTANKESDIQLSTNNKNKPAKRLVKNKATFRKLVKYLDAKDRQKKDSLLADRPKWGSNPSYKSNNTTIDTEQSLSPQNISSISKKSVKQSKKSQPMPQTPTISPNILRANQARQKARQNVEKAQQFIDSMESDDLDNDTDSDSFLFYDNLLETSNSSLDYNLPQLPDIPSTDEYQKEVEKRRKINEALLDDVEDSSSDEIPPKPIKQTKRQSKSRLLLSQPVSFTTSNALSEEIEKLTILVDKFKSIIENLEFSNNSVRSNAQNDDSMNSNKIQQNSNSKVIYNDIDSNLDSYEQMSFDQNQLISISNTEEEQYQENEEEIQENEHHNEEENNSNEENNANDSHEEEKHENVEEQEENHEEEVDEKFDDKLKKVMIPSLQLPEEKPPSEQMSDYENRVEAWQHRFDQPSSEQADVSSSSESNVVKEPVQTKKSDSLVRKSNASVSEKSTNTVKIEAKESSNVDDDEEELNSDSNPVRKTASEWRKYFVDFDSDTDDDNIPEGIKFDIGIGGSTESQNSEPEFYSEDEL